MDFKGCRSSRAGELVGIRKSHPHFPLRGTLHISAMKYVVCVVLAAHIPSAPPGRVLQLRSQKNRGQLGRADAPGL